MPYWHFNSHAAAALRCTRPLLAYNKSSGYRWSPIPKPPPPHFDRLYGVHSVLSTLRVAAAAAQQHAASQGVLNSTAERNSDSPASSSHSTGTAPPLTGFGRTSLGVPHTSAGLHPHRAHLTCLYVRDFSAEEAEKEEQQRGTDGTRRQTSPSQPQQQQQRRKRVIPRQYTAVRCIAALAKSLEVPVRFVPRRELVQLCGERRNQNVVLEASSYLPRSVHSLADVFDCDDASSLPPSPLPAEQLVLYLDHIIDPTNIGGILRTAFFFGVDHVVLSRDCAACTATVSRTSTGFLEHLHVCQAAAPTAEFLRASHEAWSSAEARLDVIASMVVPTAANHLAPASDTTEADVTTDNGSRTSAASAALPEPQAASDSEVRDASRYDSTKSTQPHIRMLLLGNEDAGLRLELLPWCTHVAHVRSPRQARLRQMRGVRGEEKTTRTSPTSCSEETNGEAAAEADVPAKRSWTELEKRAHELQRLARIREKEVSLNVNTATAALLTALAAVEGQSELPTGCLGMVEVKPL